MLSFFCRKFLYSTHQHDAGRYIHRLFTLPRNAKALSSQKGVSCSHSRHRLSSCYGWILPHLFLPYSPSLPYEIAVWVFCLSPLSVLSLPDRRTSRLFPSFPSPSLPASLPVPSPLSLSARPPATFRVQLLANHYEHFAGVELGANTRTSPCFG